MHPDLERAAVDRVVTTYRGTPHPGGRRQGEREPRHTVRLGPIAMSVPAGEVERAHAVLQALDELGMLPARTLAQLFPDRATGRAATLQTVLTWMRGQRADGGA